MGLFNNSNLEEKKQKINELEKKIKDLKKENKELKKKAEKENKRAKESVTEKQEADRKINKLKDKIRTLKDKLEKTEVELKEEKKVNSGVSYKLTKMSYKQGMKTLKKLESIESDENDLLTILKKKNDKLGELKNIEKVKSYLDYPRYSSLKEMGETVNLSYFEAPNLIKTYLKPPLLSISDCKIGNNFIIEPIKTDLTKKIGFIFIYGGGSAVGTAKKGEIVESNIITSDIKSKHSKGGYSQGRFERIRQKQLKEHKEKVEEEAKEFISNKLDFIVLGGNQKLIKQLKIDIDQKKINRKSINVRKIKDKDNLNKAIKQALSFRLDASFNR